VAKEQFLAVKALVSQRREVRKEGPIVIFACFAALRAMVVAAPIPRGFRASLFPFTRFENIFNSTPVSGLKDIRRIATTGFSRVM
jgi:hypothetical protein